MEADLPVVVIDNGSALTKAGLSNNAEQISIFRSSVAFHWSYRDRLSDLKPELLYAGSIMDSKRSVREAYAMDRGLVTNWMFMEKIWRETFFSEARADPAEHSVLLTEHPFNPVKNREETAKIMFESFHVPSLYMIPKAPLALYTAQRMTGAVLQSGYGLTYAMPILNGTPLTKYCVVLDLGAKDINQHFVSLYVRSHPHHAIDPGSYTMSEEVPSAREMNGYVALDYEAELLKGDKLKVYFEFSDGHIAELGIERFQANEILFNPSLFGLETDGIHQMIRNCIKKCDPEVQAALFKNIIVSGGTARIFGITERLKKELKALAPDVEIQVTKANREVEAPWYGGTILARDPQFSKLSVSLADYNECGPSVVNKFSMPSWR